MGKVFGKAAKSTQTSESQSQSESKNLAFPFLQESLSPFIGQAQQAGASMANMLGLNGAQPQSDAFDAWRGSTGYNFGLNQGMGAITGGAATKGLLNSGSTLKALNEYGQNFANTQYGNYVDQLMGLINPGLQGANTIANAGQVSNSTSTSTSTGTSKGPTKGFGGVVGSVLGK